MAIDVKTFNVLLSVFLFLLTLTVYTITLSQGVHLEDDGAFIYASYAHGIAHPPGYPLYTNIGHLFTKIEIGSIAGRVHFMSAFFGALTIVLVFRVSALLSKSTVSPLIFALALAFSNIFWSQSIIAEVYTLNTALFFLTYYLSLRLYFEQTPIKRSQTITFFLIGILFGLSCSNHWPLAVISAPAFIILFWRDRLNTLKQIPISIAGFTIGLTPYIWMFFAANSTEAVVAFGEIRSIEEFIYYISRKGYSSVDTHPNADFIDKFRYISFFFQQSYYQFGFVTVLFALLGAFKYLYSNTVVGISLIFGVVAHSIILSLILGFEFQLFNALIFSVYPLISYAFICILASIGFMELFGFLIHHSPTNNTRVATIISSIAVGLLLPITLVFKNLPEFQNSSDWTNEYTIDILDILPDGSTLMTSEDVDTGPFAYVYFVEERRNDAIDVYNSFGALYPNRVVHPYESETTRSATMKKFYQSRSGNIFFSGDLYLPRGNIFNHGLFYGYGDTSSLDLRFEALRIKYLDKLKFNFNKPRSWMNIQKQKIATRLMLYYLSENRFDSLSRKQKSSLLSHFDAAHTFLQTLVDNSESENQIFKLIAHCESLLSYAITNKKKSDFYYTKAKALQKFEPIGRDAIINSLSLSIQLSPNKDNPSIALLLQEYYDQKEFEKVGELIQRLDLPLEHNAPFRPS